MAREVATPEKQAELLKDQGNKFFKKDRLAAAIEAYTEVPLRCSHSKILFHLEWDGRDFYPIRAPWWSLLLTMELTYFLRMWVASLPVVLHRTPNSVQARHCKFLYLKLVTFYLRTFLNIHKILHTDKPWGKGCWSGNHFVSKCASVLDQPRTLSSKTQVRPLTLPISKESIVLWHRWHSLVVEIAACVYEISDWISCTSIMCKILVNIAYSPQEKTETNP